MTGHSSDIALDRCLRTVWRRTQGRHATAAILAFARWFVPLVLGVVLTDWFLDLPAWLRAIAAAAVLGVAAVQAWRNGGAALRSFNASRTAQQVEEASGDMDSLLVTAVQFRERGAAPGTSAAMWELASREAQSVAGRIAPRDVVPLSPLVRPLGITLGLAAIVVAVAMLRGGGFLATGFARMFAPWLAVEYPTDTLIDLGNGELVIQEGAPATITIGLAGKVPQAARLLLQTGTGRPREIQLEVVDGQCTYELAAASRDFSYRVRAGDARSEWRPVRVVPAPRVDAVAVRLDFPDYMDRPDETVEALTLTVPEDTNVHWQLTLDTPIRAATLHRDDADDLPLAVGADGRTLTLTEAASASRGYSFSWIEDRHGFRFASPRYFLQVATDQPPRIELTSPLSNLDALLGRPLELSVRASDDHGIGATRIVYRVNRRPEQTVDLPVPVAGRDGEQPLDWDYRTEVPNLAIGDSVAFLVEVADKYPGEGGPHRARSETRRLTFLARDDYLAEVTKQMERLLNRVRTLYRQERVAYDVTVALDPTAESFLATCQLEAIRQEMVREQLGTTADDVQALLDDLAANQVTDAVEGDSLASLRDALRGIAEDHVARAADLLRAQVGAEARDPRPASAAVNQAARELAGLVLLRGIDAAREVYARETQMLAQELARLRLRLVTGEAHQAEAVATAIDDVAAWTDDLLRRLSAGMPYGKRPLAVLGLSRRIHTLRTARLTEALRSVAADTRAGKPEQSASLSPLIRPLIEAAFTMRSGVEYAAISTLREQLAAWAVDQERLLADVRAADDFGTTAASLARRQAALRDALVLAVLPGIPAPRATLLDLTFPPVPPGDACRHRAETLATEAVAALHAQARDEATACQQKVVEALRELESIVDRWAPELAQKTLGASMQVSDANERIAALEAFEARQIRLIEHTEEFALDDNDPAALIEDLAALADDLDRFREDLSVGVDKADGMLLLRSRIGVAKQAIERALNALSAKEIEEAIEPEEQAAEALAEARVIAQEQLVTVTLQQQLVAFQQAVADASGGMVDLIGGQQDTMAATGKADDEQLTTLLAPQRNLWQCLTDIAPSLNVVASRLDVGTPLVFAASDIEDALVAMEDGEAEEAAEIQQTAIESLLRVQRLVAEVAVQTGYVTEIVTFLHDLQSDGGMLAFRQRQLREQGNPEGILKEQQALAADARAYGDAMTMVAGRIDFALLDEKTRERFAGLELTLDGMAPATHMTDAIRLLEAGQPATDAMEAAEAALRAHAQQANVVIAMLNGLPGIVLSQVSPPELHRLIALLDIASKQRVLMRHTYACADAHLPSLATAQQTLAQDLAKAAQAAGLEQHPLLATACEQTAPIADMLTTSNKAAAAAQRAVDQTLRHFIIEQALILNTAVPPASSSDSEVVTEAETDDLYYTESVGFVSDFVSGEAPKDKKSEWEILGERNRAALNQNFARELPLEYRATLKNYYERVAK